MSEILASLFIEVSFQVYWKKAISSQNWLFGKVLRKLRPVYVWKGWKITSIWNESNFGKSSKSEQEIYVLSFLGILDGFLYLFNGETLTEVLCGSVGTTE